MHLAFCGSSFWVVCNALKRRVVCRYGTQLLVLLCAVLPLQVARSLVPTRPLHQPFIRRSRSLKGCSVTQRGEVSEAKNRGYQCVSPVSMLTSGSGASLKKLLHLVFCSEMDGTQSSLSDEEDTTIQSVSDNDSQSQQNSYHGVLSSCVGQKKKESHQLLFSEGRAPWSKFQVEQLPETRAGPRAAVSPFAAAFTSSSCSKVAFSDCFVKVTPCSAISQSRRSNTLQPPSCRPHSLLHSTPQFVIHPVSTSAIQPLISGEETTSPTVTPHTFSSNFSVVVSFLSRVRPLPDCGFFVSQGTPKDSQARRAVDVSTKLLSRSQPDCKKP